MRDQSTFHPCMAASLKWPLGRPLTTYSKFLHISCTASVYYCPHQMILFPDV
uniref:Uncharacterized protein n=1 Tax=Rhizophora mucronata TaxID=61149 RepID=A0A2P2PVS7_RHIMU